MHTFYITGGNANDRLQYITHVCNELGVTAYDIHSLVPKVQALSIGISDIRQWQKELFLMPLSSPFTIGIIPNAELLTTEAQNALLKTLEEPPSHTRIYIESQVSATLLPTVISRCQIIQLTTKPLASKDESNQVLTTLLQLGDVNLSTGKKMLLLDEHITNKEEAKIWVTQAMHILHTHRKTVSPDVYLYIMKHLLTISQHLAANVSYKLAIDQITFPKIH